MAKTMCSIQAPVSVDRPSGDGRWCRKSAAPPPRENCRGNRATSKQAVIVAMPLPDATAAAVPLQRRQGLLEARP